MKVINPATEELIREIPEDDAKSVQEKFELLKKGHPDWAKLPVQKRVDCIQRFYDLLLAEKDDLAKTLTAEVGKPLKESYNELNGARARMKYFIDNSVKWLSEEWIVTEGTTKEKIVYEPFGVIANISAWNYPYLVGVNVFIPALIGGNAILYKPSEYSTLTGLAIQNLLYKAGVPENVFQSVIGKGNVGERGGGPGDLIILIEEEAHPHLHREGLNVAYDLFISFLFRFHCRCGCFFFTGIFFFFVVTTCHNSSNCKKQHRFFHFVLSVLVYDFLYLHRKFYFGFFKEHIF